MFWIFLAYFFLLGIIIGSFLNVLVLRHNTGKTLGGRSACMSCGHQLTSRELVPVLSYLFQRGKCVHCRTRISSQYILVELATGILFALNFYILSCMSRSYVELGTIFILTSSIFALMVAIFVYDMRHKIIPDVFSFSAFGLSIAYAFFSQLVFKNNSYGIESFTDNPTLRFASMLAGIALYALVYAVWKISKGRLIGLGDAKLLLSIGTVLGLVYGLSAIFIAFWTGAAYAVFLMLKQRLSRSAGRITMKSEIAFGPFLILAFVLVYFTRIDVTNLGFLLQNFS